MFKWMAAVAMSLDGQLAAFLHLLLPPLVREITDPSAALELKTLATEVRLPGGRAARVLLGVGVGVSCSDACFCFCSGLCFDQY